MKIISVILLFAYSVSTFVGIGIFHCNCTHSQRLVVLAVQAACPLCNGSADGCCPHNHHQHSDEDTDEEHISHDDCCTLIYQYVKVDQLSVAQFHDIQVKVLSLLFSPFLYVDGLITDVRECSATIKNHSPPPDLLKIPLIYLHGQLRL